MGSSHRIRLLVVGIAVAFVLVAASCGGGGDDGSGGGDEARDDGEVQPGGTVVFGVTGETDGWVPQVNRWGPSAYSVARALYDPITVTDEEGVAQPYLVERFEPNEDFTEWRFWMRDGITWHNGEPLTADDIVTNLRENQLSILASNAFEPVDSVEVETDNPDPAVDWDFQVNLSEVWATFPNMLSNQTGYVVHPSTIEKQKLGEQFDPIGTGPFKWEEWIPDNHLTVSRNENYWREDVEGRTLPYLDEVEFRPIVDATTRQQALDTGEINMLTTNAASDLIDVGTEGDRGEGYQVVFDTSESDEVVLMINTSQGPTADVDVRRAIALAVDREALNQQLYDGFFELADTPYGESSRWHSDPRWPEPDPEEATRLVEAWEDEHDEDLKLTTSIIQGQEGQALAQLVQQQLGDAGIEVEVETTDEAGFAGSLVRGDFDTLLITFFNRSDPDADYHFMDPFRTEGEGQVILNFTRYTSDVMKENLPAARKTEDFEERKALYDEVWADWARNFPYVFLYHTGWILEAEDTLHGFDSFTYPDGEPAPIMDWGSVFLTGVWVEQ